MYAGHDIHHSQGGRYIIDLMDAYAAGWPLLLVGFSELIVMYWVYGVQNFFRDLGSIQGFNPGIGLKSHLTVVYGTVSPLLVGVSIMLWYLACRDAQKSSPLGRKLPDVKAFTSV